VSTKILEQINITRVAFVGLIAAAAFGAAAVRKAERIDGAVQRPELAESTRVIRDLVKEHILNEERQDSVMASFMARSEARDCHDQGYPSPWCDEIPRRERTGPMQAGRPR
jgi:hypothetical protein